MTTTPRPPRTLAEVVNPSHLKYAEEVGLDQYRREYANGAKASSSGSSSRIWEEAAGTLAWDAGYLDVAAGRDRWHLPTCPDHEACP